MPRYSAILIAGPTASGKSRLAVEFAQRVGGWVVNADSMQVYRDLRVLTARPSKDEMGGVRHELYGFVAATDAYSVARYVDDVGAVIAEAMQAGAVPVIVGGTGLYFKALLEGLSPVPPIDPAVRERWRREAVSRGAGDLHRELARLDPEMAARLMPTDPQRLVRALEVIESTGQSLAVWQRQPGVPLLESDRCLKFLLSPEREALYSRCDARFDAMIEQGALEEVRGLQQMQLDAQLPIMGALGVAPLITHIERRLPLELAIEESKRDTRRYAKRQMTWQRNQMISWTAIDLELMERNGASNELFYDLP